MKIKFDNEQQYNNPLETVGAQNRYGLQIEVFVL